MFKMFHNIAIESKNVTFSRDCASLCMYSLYVLCMYVSMDYVFFKKYALFALKKQIR